MPVQPALGTAYDPIVSQQTDNVGGILFIFQSGASYYEAPTGMWSYINAQGTQFTGDAQGNYCDSYGNCSGAWATGLQSVWNTLTSGNTPLYILGGLLVLALLSGGRRR